MKDLFEVLPMYGSYDVNDNKFHDKDKFKDVFVKFITLSKVKLWYGSCSDIPNPVNPSEKESNFKLKPLGKYILGIQ